MDIINILFQYFFGTDPISSVIFKLLQSFTLESRKGNLRSYMKHFLLFRNSTEYARAWASGSYKDEEQPDNEEASAALRTRAIAFTGKFEPVKHRCNAPLENGKFCPRQDRFKVR